MRLDLKGQTVCSEFERVLKVKKNVLLLISKYPSRNQTTVISNPPDFQKATGFPKLAEEFKISLDRNVSIEELRVARNTYEQW